MLESEVGGQTLGEIGVESVGEQDGGVEPDRGSCVLVLKGHVSRMAVAQ